MSMTFSRKSPQITLWSVSMSVAKLALSGSTAHLSPAQVLVQVDRWGEHNVQCATLPLVTSYEIHQTLFCQFLKYTPFHWAILSWAITSQLNPLLEHSCVKFNVAKMDEI